MLKTICIYCGSAAGISKVYADAMRRLAREMTEENIALVYGGGKTGLMGILADEMLRLGGKVTGIIPKNLMERELAHEALTQLHIVRDMHERKAMMANLADGFIAAPGGIGTMEELFETLTWSQLGLHEKPVGIYNANHYYDPLIGLIRHFVVEEFVGKTYFESLIVENDPAKLLNHLKTATALRKKTAGLPGRISD